MRKGAGMPRVTSCNFRPGPPLRLLYWRHQRLQQENQVGYAHRGHGPHDFVFDLAILMGENVALGYDSAPRDFGVRTLEPL
jgi:hypothetical protein